MDVCLLKGPKKTFQCVLSDFLSLSVLEIARENTEKSLYWPFSHVKSSSDLEKKKLFSEISVKLPFSLLISVLGGKTKNPSRFS